MHDEELDEFLAFIKTLSAYELVERALNLMLEINKVEQKNEVLKQESTQDTEELYDEYWHYIHQLQTNGTDEELEICQNLLASSQPAKRQIVADILGSLGYQQPEKYYDYASQQLINLLDDNDDDVVASACHGLGHRLRKDDERAIQRLVILGRVDN
ncbi:MULTISPECIES: hypothetical protein [unclassified Acinetobacter]|uniref:hypothetical protein n=1 Tax=unclassified Acinetobacter TaxID=196816 RepID=UPI0035B6EDB7